MDRKKLDDAVKDIRMYTAKHDKLLKAHHFVYDYPPFAETKRLDKPEWVVMGINPGESEEDWSEGEKKQREAGKWTPLAQTRNGERSTTDSGKKWAETIEYYTCSRLVVTSELFFWSARSQPEIENQFGQPWYKPPHLRFCLNLNQLLIAQYGPRAVLVIGITAAERVRAGFGLKLINTKRYDQNGLRIVEHHFDGQRPWFFVRHPAEREIEKVRDIGKEKIAKAAKEYIHTQLSEGTQRDVLA